MADEQKAPEGATGLMQRALEAYGIKPQHVLASKDFGDHVVIVTKGGKKVSYARGDKVKALSGPDLDGQIPEHIRAAREAAKKR